MTRIEAFSFKTAESSATQLTVIPSCCCHSSSKYSLYKIIKVIYKTVNKRDLSHLKIFFPSTKLTIMRSASFVICVLYFYSCYSHKERLFTKETSIYHPIFLFFNNNKIILRVHFSIFSQIFIEFSAQFNIIYRSIVCATSSTLFSARWDCGAAVKMMMIMIWQNLES